MKFRIDQDALADAAAWGARFVPLRPVSPSMSGIKLEAAGDRLAVSAFDNETYGRAEVEADIGDEGTVLVNGRLLAEIVRSLPKSAVDVVADGAKVNVSCGRARFALPTIPLEEYPLVPEMPPPVGTIPGDRLAEAVAQVAVASSKDDMLPQLTGMRIELGPESVTLAATDRYRLAVREVPWQAADSQIDLNALIPARQLAETVKSLGSSEVLLSVGDAGLFGLTTDTRQSSARLIDADFPKYQTLFPKEAETVATIDRGALTEAVKRVSLVAERNSAIRMMVQGDQVTLQAQSTDDAEASEVVAAEVDGEDLVAGFNPGYLLDGLGALHDEVATLSFTQPNRPVVITGAEADYRYLLMPVRLAG